MTKITLNLQSLLTEALAGESAFVPVSVDVADIFDFNDIDQYEADIDELLRQNGMIARTWSVTDVQRRRQDLDEAQAWRVLDEMWRRNALEESLGEDLIERTAYDLFGTSNSQRVERCEKALAVYDEPELIDLLADAIHWCADKGRDFDAALATARVHFDSETQAR